MHDTFLSLLQDRAHWEFELFLMVLFDVLIAGILWPFVRLHWRHHIDRDRRDGSDIKWAKKVGDETTDPDGNTWVCAGPAEKPAKTCSFCGCDVTEVYIHPLGLSSGKITCWLHADNFYTIYPERLDAARLRHRDIPNTVPLKSITKTD